MCFSRSLPGKAPSSCVPATRSPVWWDDVYNNGERQSNFTQHARHGSHLSPAAPAPHLKRDEIENSTNFMYRATWGEAESRHRRASDAISPWQGACQNQEISQGCFFLLSSLFSTTTTVHILYPWGTTRKKHANTFWRRTETRKDFGHATHIVL